MEQFSFGRVFSRAFSLIKETLPSTGLFILILLLLEAAAGMIAQPILLGQMTSAAATAGNESLEPMLAMFQSGAYLATLVISAIALGMAWAGGLHGLLQHAWGQPVTMADCFRAALRRFFPVLGLVLLYWIAVALGWILFFVPATIIGSMWAVAVAAQVGEGQGVFAAFGRSRELTRGCRLTIFGVLVVVVILYYVVAIALIGGIVGGGAFAGALTPQAALGLSWWIPLAVLPMSWVTGMLLKAVVASLYLETLLVKEGGRTDELSGVFD